MARKKAVTPKKVNHQTEISAVFALAAAVLMGVAYYWPGAQAGWLGKTALMLGKGFFGIGAYAIPALLLFIAIEYFFVKNVKKANWRMIFVVGFLVSLTSLVHLFAVDQSLFQKLFQTDDGTFSAIQAVGMLWKTGVNPALISDATHLTGGLIPGLIGQALLALAGPIGSKILTSALVLAFLVLITNISYTQTVHNTAKAMRDTSKMVDTAVRSAREREATARRDAQHDTESNVSHYETKAQAKSFDIEVSASTAEDTRRTMLQGWSDFWQKRSTLRKTAEPDANETFHDGGFTTITGGTSSTNPGISFDGFTDEEAKVADFIKTSKLPYSLGKDENGFLTIIQNPFMDQHDDSENGSTGDFIVEPPKKRRTTVKKDGLTLETAVDAQADDNDDRDDRSSWTDRSELGSVTHGISKSSVNRKVSPGGQLELDVPYAAPPLSLLRDDNISQNVKNSQSSIEALGRKLEQTLESFGVSAKVVHFTTGPTITRFELSPGPGVKVSKIVNLADDIALNLAAMGVRIEAPIPGKAAIGIEIPNKETMPVLLKSLMDSADFKNAKSPLTAAIGRDIQGNPLLCDLAKMPHMLIAGATGSGKSVCINSILMSILFKASPDEVKMLMIDPKVVELNIYNGIPHLIHPVVTDPKKAAGTLQWAVNEMIRRYSLFAAKSVRDIASYNASVGFDLDDDDEEKLPLILIVIDELSDLMATTPTEVEDAIARLTAMARAAGIHLIIATQRPSVDVITGVIKANIPSRVAFAVASQIDSRTILDMAGAEKLLGKGDMLYYPQSAAKPIRGQGAFITDAEVERVIAHVKSLHKTSYDQRVAEAISSSAVANGRKEKDEPGENDELLPQALQICVETGYASVSLLQRRMTVGYPRAARLIDRMHELGYIGGFEGSKPRKVLITLNQLLEMQMKAQIVDRSTDADDDEDDDLI
ncbi:MAG: DNA translocase FtsK [Eubacteriales bacterium]|nr:DNA translocase FtsK [Eubacteriales bacterium]